MSRIYIRNDENKWNVWSTINDNYIFDSFVTFEELKKYMIEELIRIKNEELDTLLTNYPRLNVLPLREFERQYNIDKDSQQKK